MYSFIHSSSVTVFILADVGVDLQSGSLIITGHHAHLEQLKLGTWWFLRWEETKEPGGNPYIGVEFRMDFCGNSVATLLTEFESSSYSGAVTHVHFLGKKGQMLVLLSPPENVCQLATSHDRGSSHMASVTLCVVLQCQRSLPIGLNWFPILTLSRSFKHDIFPCIFVIFILFLSITDLFLTLIQFPVKWPLRFACNVHDVPSLHYYFPWIYSPTPKVKRFVIISTSVTIIHPGE